MQENDGSNEIAEEEDLSENEVVTKRGPGCLIKTLAILTLLAFIVFIIPNFTALFSAKLPFLEQNRALMADQIVQRCKPAVVSIEATAIDGPFNTAVHQGTGFNISPTGVIITNQHVIANARSVSVTFDDGKKYYSDQFTLVPGADLAVIKLAGNNLPVLPLDLKDHVQNGDTVTIIGNPLGFEQISQRGVVGEFYQMKDTQSPVFEIKIPINPGNSGSPVINDQAQVAGIVFASISLTINGKPETRALAIPVQALAQVLPIK
ncbi:MAG: trypsin-like peptidase domain-containing protein [Thermacetogeniaceae bacterium]